MNSKKQRPGVIVSSDSLGALAIKLIVPITTWSPNFQGKVWHVQITPNQKNGLTKLSSADTLQTRSVSLQRFIKKLGSLDDIDLEKIITALTIVIEF